MWARCGSSTSPSLNRLCVKEEYSPTTIRDTIAMVQQVFNWAVDQELLDISPVPKYKKPAAHSRSRVITPDEFKAIFRKADRNFRRFLIALRLTGCRPGELRKLIWGMGRSGAAASGSSPNTRPLIE